MAQCWSPSSLPRQFIDLNRSIEGKIDLIGKCKLDRFRFIVLWPEKCEISHHFQLSVINYLSYWKIVDHYLNSFHSINQSVNKLTIISDELYWLSSIKFNSSNRLNCNKQQKIDDNSTNTIAFIVYNFCLFKITIFRSLFNNR